MGVSLAVSRRQRILASAEAEFVLRGFSGARVERIAAAASVNKQLLFHYFGSKAGLFQAVSDAFSQRFDLDARIGTTPTERLRGLVSQLVRAGQGHRTLLHEQWRSMAVNATIRIIEDGQRSGHFRDDADPGPVAEIVVAASLGISWSDTSTGASQGGDARFEDSLVQIVVDHCSWR